MKTLLLALAPVLALAAPATAAPLDDVAASLKATTSLGANFTQTGADGRVLTGKMILARPGKIRFQYDTAKLLIVGNGKTLTFVDYKVNQVSQWPVKSTPLGILLSSEPDLSRVATVTEASANRVVVEARDPKRPEFGSLSIAFARDAAAPGGLALKGWTARDAQGGTSTVQLSGATYNADLSKADFGFKDPRRPVTRG
ncbi:MAG: cell envelope biogenesis protein LolA [Alphaproteobacteria bacterium]|nr:MAG: cell envelope biogenesis protein LolA [Alphaproteobacteria bacterium]